MTKKETQERTISSTAALGPKLEQQIEAARYLEQYSKTKDIKYLRLAIKKDPEVLFLDERMRGWIYEIGYKASIPHPGKEYKDAREFMDDMRLLKPEKQGEILIFFGSGYHLESCLGIKFIHNSKPQLISNDAAAIIYFVNELKELWKKYHIDKKIFKFKNESKKKTTIYEFCNTLGLKISKNELSWGSTYYATNIALTILGIANMKRFKLLLSKYPKHELNKYAGKFFSFHTLQRLHKKLKNIVSSDNIKKVSSIIKSAKNKDNPFIIRYDGAPTDSSLVHPRQTLFILEKDGILRQPSYAERINFLEQKLSVKKSTLKKT